MTTLLDIAKSHMEAAATLHDAVDRIADLESKLSAATIEVNQTKDALSKSITPRTGPLVFPPPLGSKVWFSKEVEVAYHHGETEIGVQLPGPIDTIAEKGDILDHNPHKADEEIKKLRVEKSELAASNASLLGTIEKLAARLTTQNSALASLADSLRNEAQDVINNNPGRTSTLVRVASAVEAVLKSTANP